MQNLANSSDLSEILSSGTKSSDIQSPLSNGGASAKHHRGSSLDSMINYTTLDSSSIANNHNTNRKLYQNEDELSKIKTNKSFSQYVNPNARYEEMDDDAVAHPALDVNPMVMKVCLRFRDLKYALLFMCCFNSVAIRSNDCEKQIFK